MKVFKKSLIFILSAIMVLAVCGCQEAENLQSDQSGTAPSEPIDVYTSRELNRYIVNGSPSDYVVDQYGNKVEDCTVDEAGNIYLNGRLIINNTDTLHYAKPKTMLLASTKINVVVNTEFSPKVVFFPDTTSCQEIKIKVIEGAHTVSADGKVTFTATGTAKCEVYSAANEALRDTCTVNVYANEGEIPKVEKKLTTYGEVYLGDYFNMDKQVYLDWLASHQNDTYYLTTPYQSAHDPKPNGDTLPGKSPGMNCTSFVWHALSMSIGMSPEASNEKVPGMTGWTAFYRSKNIKRYNFDTKDEMLASGVLQKGDIIWIWDQNGENSKSESHHVGIYYGDGTSDVFWHSLDGMQIGLPYDGNMISHIETLAKPSRYVVLDVYE